MLALLLLLSAGALAGYVARLRPRLVTFNQGATRWAIGALLFIMGTKLARARGLFARDLGVLLAAVASAALLVAGLFALFLVLGLFRKGRAAERDPEAAGASAGHELAGVFWNLAWIVLGAGLLLALPERAGAALPLDAAADGLLRLLAAVIGFDLGAEFHKLRLRELPRPVLLLPFANIALSLACGALFALLRGLPVRQGLLLYAGLGWYSLSSVMIAQKGLVVMSLLAFIHNVFREILGILTAPLAARISPYLPIYIGGATTMDTMLPFVQRHCGRTYTLVAFYSGIVCSMAVIPLVRLLLGA